MAKIGGKSGQDLAPVALRSMAVVRDRRIVATIFVGATTMFRCANSLPLLMRVALIKHDGLSRIAKGGICPRCGKHDTNNYEKR